MPLVLGDTVQDPEVTLSRGALLDAGASLGEKAREGLKKLFGY